MHDFAPNRIASRHMAGLVLLLLALTGLAGCGQSRDDSVPPPDVDAAWVKATRKNATKVAAADTASTQTFDGWCDLQGTIIVTGDRPQMVERLAQPIRTPFASSTGPAANCAPKICSSARGASWRTRRCT